MRKRQIDQPTHEHVDLPASALRCMQEAARLGKLAEEGDDIKTALLAVREYARATELLSKLRENHAPSIDITRHPEYLELRDTILAAIWNCADCRRHVIAALGLESGREVVPALSSGEKR